MTGEEARAFLESVSWRGSVPGLSRIRELLERVGNPQDSLRFVHIAGTNGKGSTAAMLASVLRCAGCRTGLYSSPYLEHFNERMQVNGTPVSDAALAAVCEALQPETEAMADTPTAFELITAAALLWFAAERCDIVVLETGLGGRLDATNVIAPPDCAVLANIGLDHTEILGDTVEKIAWEKAGILKPGTRAVSYQQTPEAAAVLRRVCAGRGVPLREADFSAITPLEDTPDGQRFRYRGTELTLPLLGAHQRKNAAVALEALDVLRGRGFRIPPEAAARGFRETVWPGRFEILRRKPWFVLDGGHNPQCMETVAANLRHYFPQRRKLLLLGVLADKDLQTMLGIIAPEADAFVAAAPESGRALPAETLAAALRPYGKPVTVCTSVPGAVRTALRLAGPDDVICAAGSLYLAGAVRRFLRREDAEHADSGD